MSISTWLPALLIVVCQSVCAQQVPYFINSTEVGGLSDNRVNCVFKDRTGYIWIGTENGLNRFDGNEYKIYKPTLSGTNNLSSSFVTAIAEDREGTIWVATHKGLNRIDVQSDSSIFIVSSDPKGDPLSGKMLWDVFSDTDTSVWAAIDTKYLLQYNPKNKQSQYFDFRKFIQDNKIQYSNSYHSVFKISRKSKHELWLATTDGIFIFNSSTRKFSLEYGVALDEITFFYFDSDKGKLYCADERQILYIYESGTGKMNRVAIDPVSNRNKYLSPYVADKEGLFIPAPDGLVFVNQRNEVAAFISGSNNYAEAVLPGKITTVYKDREGISWIGTRNGLSRFIPDLNKNLRVRFPRTLLFDPEYSLKKFRYDGYHDRWVLASFADNTIWMVDNKTGIKSIFNKPEIFGNDTCFALYAHHPDTLYYLCDRAILSHSVKNNSWQRINLPPDFQQSSITCLTIDSEGKYWIGTRRKGLLVYDPQSKKFWSPQQEQVDAAIIHAVAFDKLNQTVWIGTYNTGLYQYSLANKKFIRIQTRENTTQTLHSLLINDIAIDNKGNAWSGTVEGGLSKLSIEQGKITEARNFNIGYGLPDNNVHSVVSSDKGTIYFTTSKGISWIDANERITTLLNGQLGFPSSKFQESIVIVSDNFVATTIDDELFCFSPESYRKPAIEKLIINNIMIHESENISFDKHSFDFKSNTISFNFVLLDFVSPSTVEYLCKLEGFDKDWVSNGNRRNIRYGELQPGTYTFQVKTKRQNGGQNQQVASWKFTINPPFWRTWWFWSILIGVLATLIGVLIQRRLIFLRQKESVKRDYEKRIAEVEMQALRAQMNPHFMFNSLNSINNFILKNDADNASGYLTKFSRLMRLILDNSRNEWVVLENELKALELYIELEAVRFDQAFSYSIQVDPAVSVATIAIPPMLIQPYVENAIWHGLLHRKEPGSKLTLRIWRQQDQLLIEIEDNGIGRDEADKRKSKTATSQKSLGMKITEERIAIVNRVYNVNASTTITDIKDERGVGLGTRVLLTLQYKTHESYYSR